MLFNSFVFLLFFFSFFILYWLLNKKIVIRNIFILASSYFFYAWWDWRFLGLIIFSTIVDYVLAILIEGENKIKIKRLYLSISLVANLGLLAFFKYFNFFIGSFSDLMHTIGIQSNISSLNIILPVGISFYTFQTLSYTIDVYRNKLTPTKNVINFAAFVSFFPQLVAGPIERATRLLPQFDQVKKFDFNNAKIGFSQIIWGFFKKIVIADNCAVYADQIFNNYTEQGSITLILGAILFAFQIYCDFSAYSDIAIGLSRLLGFDLMTNFRYPYFSRDIAEFWRRWHISLSTWFRDYLYIPLGGSRVKLGRNIINIFAIFLISGFWHGANWTFVAWGGLNALYFIPLVVFNLNRNNLDTIGDGNWMIVTRDTASMVLTFLLTCIAWVFFRSVSIADAITYLRLIFEFNNDLSIIAIPLFVWVMIFYLIFIDFVNRKRDYVYFRTNLVQFMFLISTLILILLFGYFVEERSFIYFQF